MGLILTDKIHYESIASAIRTKNGKTEKYYPYEMAQAILDIPTGSGEDTPNIKDIYNHGDIEGLNPYYRVTGSKSLSDGTIYIVNEAEGRRYFTFPFSNVKYSKMCIDCSAVSYDNVPSSLENMFLYLGVVKFERIINPYYSIYEANVPAATSLDVQTTSLLSAESPTYPRTVVEITLNQSIPTHYLIGLHMKYARIMIYSVWLE